MSIGEFACVLLGSPKVLADGAKLEIALATLGGSWFYGPFEGLT